MRYYIEAYDHYGQQVLGNLDGQCALGNVRRPERCTAWKNLPLVHGNKRPSPRVAKWILVNEKGETISTKEV
jgi:hypothetical protein